MFDDFDNSIIICSSNKKKYILKNIKKLINLKILTMEQFLKLYLFNYDEKAILYIIKKYNIKYEIALEYLENIYYIEDKKYNNFKLDFLVNLKQELKDNNLLIFDEKFKETLKNKRVIIYDYPLNSFEKHILKNLNYEEIQLEKREYKPVIYEFNDIEEEIDFLAYTISELIRKKIPINKIKITNIDSDYINLINKIFGFYNLKIDKQIDVSILSTVIGNTFFSNIDNGLEYALKQIEEYQNTDIYNKLVDVCNKFIWCQNKEDLKILLTYHLNHTYLKETKYTNTIEVIDYKDYEFTDEYVFMLNFNQGVIPNIKKDEDFISDNIKPTYLDNSVMTNIFRKKNTLNIIKRIPNLTITYKLKSAFNSFYPSNLIEELDCNPIHKELDYTKSYSALSNKLKLGRSIDNLIKFGEYSQNIGILNTNYNIAYNSYSNEFTGLNKDKLKNYIRTLKTFNLSYSSVDNYNRCAFRFYLDKIMKLKKSEDSFSATLGNIYHYILSIYSDKQINVEKEVYNYIKDLKLTNSNMFFVRRAIKDIEELLKILDKQKEYSNLKKEEKEKQITINLKDNIDFTGFIDKVVYNTFDDKIIGAIIDYKTYIKKPTLRYLDYGIGLQLPVYMFLARKVYPNLLFAGFYLQNITLNEKSEESMIDSLKLIGYTNLDTNILKEFDKTYLDSLLIKGLKVKNDGTFMATSQKYMLSSEKMEDLILKTSTKIDETLENILDSKFSINPKYDNGNIGCEFCKYKDICFMTDSDLVKIEVGENCEQMD